MLLLCVFLLLLLLATLHLVTSRCVLSHRRNPVDWYPVALAYTYSAFAITFCFLSHFQKPSRARWLVIAFIQYALFWFLLVLKCYSNCKANWDSLFLFNSLSWRNVQKKKNPWKNSPHEILQEITFRCKSLCSSCACMFPSRWLFNCLCFWHFEAVIWTCDKIQTRAASIQTGNQLSKCYRRIKLKIKCRKMKKKSNGERFNGPILLANSNSHKWHNSCLPTRYHTLFPKSEGKKRRSCELLLMKNQRE